MKLKLKLERVNVAVSLRNIVFVKTKEETINLVVSLYALRMISHLIKHALIIFGYRETLLIIQNGSINQAVHVIGSRVYYKNVNRIRKSLRDGQ